MLAYGHRSGLEAKHECCVGGSWYISIADGELERLGCDMKRDAVLCEVQPGDVLFINNLIPHRSLTNVSNGIRWSLDLRWQLPDLPNGFYGIKPCLRLTDSTDPAYVPDWSAWANDDRQAKQLAAAMAMPEVATQITAEGTAAAAATSFPTNQPQQQHQHVDDEFDSAIAGPWMGRWRMVNHNKHTERYALDRVNGGSTWHGIATGGAFG